MPKLLLKQKQGKPTFIRLTPDERAIYIASAKQKDYRNLSEYLRFLLRLGFQTNV